MSDESNVPDRPLIGFITGDHAPPISPAPINRTWMSEMRRGWANRCLPLLIANQGGWELRNPSAFSATWMGGDNRTDLMIVPDTRDPRQFLPASNFGYGILTWHLPMLFRTPAGYDLLVRGPANHPKDAISALEGIVETDWASASFSMSWKFTRKLMPVRFEIDEPICMIVPQRRGELEEFAPNSGTSGLIKIYAASMSSSCAHATRWGKPRQRRTLPRESACRGKATTREAAMPTARPGRRITRLAVSFVRLFSHKARTSNRAARVGTW